MVRVAARAGNLHSTLFQLAAFGKVAPAALLLVHDRRERSGADRRAQELRDDVREGLGRRVLVLRRPVGRLDLLGGEEAERHGAAQVRVFLFQLVEPHLQLVAHHLARRAGAVLLPSATTSANRR